MGAAGQLLGFAIGGQRAPSVASVDSVIEYAEAADFPALGVVPASSPASILLASALGTPLASVAVVLRAVINGQPCEFQADTSIPAALQAIGIRVPTLCYDERLAPTGTCRLCLVSVKGWPRLVTACTTPLVDGMEIETQIPALEEHRQSLLKLLAWRYPVEAVAQVPEKEFHRYVREFGLEGELQGQLDAHLEDRSHPYIAVDMSRCIDCYRCVRICDEVQGQRA